MTLLFYKYEGTGNDFIIIDNREKIFAPQNRKLIANMCHRRLGIGADGLILIEGSDTADFKMMYFNADGNAGSMCGNGGRCAVAFARRMGIINAQAAMETYDGVHKAKILSYNSEDFNAEVSLQMNDVSRVEIDDDFSFMNTGSPHCVKFIHTISTVDVIQQGRKIRYSERFEKDGTNVNFAQFDGHRLIARTYERGVEDETLSCGTGVTAVAIAYALKCSRTGYCEMPVKTSGGELMVKFNSHSGQFTNVFLEGPATFVFEGKY